MRKLAEKKFNTMPDMFTDPSYINMNRYVLSTSTLSSDVLSGAAFAPVFPTGFGIGYSFVKDLVGSSITYYDGMRDGEGFKSALVSSCDQLRDLLHITGKN